MPRNNVAAPVRAKPYTIAMVGTNDAEINMYGEVVDEHPVDWWTGEPVPGNYIALDDFLHDLDELGTKDNITIHINSVGGSLYAGLAIYNRLKSMPANIITVNDSLAASAASIIFMAGDTRKVHAGSSLMIHGAAGFLYGYYQVPDLKTAIKSLDSSNKTAAAAYAEATGKDADTVKSLMDKETWMTGQEAVDAGFADEVIGDTSGVSMSLSPDKRFIVSNGVAMSTRGLATFPAGIPTMPAAVAAEYRQMKSVSPAPQVDINDKEMGGNHMEFKNADDLRAAIPDLVAQIENAAKDAGYREGVQAEQDRIQGIEGIEAAIGDKELVKYAKFGESRMTAEQLALKAMQAQAAIGATVLQQLEDDTANSGVGEVIATPAVDDVADDTKEEQDAIAFMASIRPKKEGK